MLKIQGIEQKNLPFEMSKFIGVLLYEEFPVTSVYEDENKNPVIKEWIDCEDKIDRSIIFQTSKELLKSFLESKISHKEFILNPKDGISFVIDENEQIERVWLISSNYIADEYLPKMDVFYDSNDGVQSQKVVENFDLDKISNEDKNETYKELAIKNDIEVFNLHLKKGIGIRFGRVDTDLLGETLLDFDNLFKEVSLDHFYGVNRGELSIKRNEKQEKLNLASTEVFLYKAASFSVYIKPKYTNQIDLFEGKSTSNIISQNLFNLIRISKDEKELKENYLKYSDFVYKSYKHFLKNIVQYDFKLDLNWSNESANQTYNEEFGMFKANEIIESLQNISTEETSNFKIKGKFTALNCNTGSFKFTSNQEELFSGYFDKLVKDSVATLNFTNLYEISIERKMTKEAGNPDLKIKYIIIAHYHIKEKKTTGNNR